MAIDLQARGLGALLGASGGADGISMDPEDQCQSRILRAFIARSDVLALVATSARRKPLARLLRHSVFSQNYCVTDL